MTQRKSVSGGLGALALAAVVAVLVPGSVRGAPVAVSTAAVGGQTEWLVTPVGRLKAQVFTSPQATPRPVLVVVLHGDAPFDKQGYQYTFAARAAVGDVVAAAILRPGYTDAVGDTSDGVRGISTGDNYTRDRIDAIVAAIGELKARHHARAVVLVGHSGGAAISADILALHPGLAQAALLASCPCDLKVWRAHMKAKQGGAPIWDLPVQSYSPIELAPQAPRGTIVELMVGDADDVAPPALTDAYAAVLARAGLTARVVRLPGKGHEILLEPQVQAELQAVLERLREG
jgi:pimeloyl-ACP methyl ester carboxylesterase